MSSSARSKRSDTEEREKSGPIFSRRAWTGTGSVEVAVFPKMIDGNDGEYRVFNTIAKRCWKEGEEYKSGNAFRPEDLLILALFLQEATSFICTEQAKR